MSLKCQHLLVSCVLLLAISVRVTCRRYNNGLVFYDLRTHMVYLPPTVSAARGRSLGSVKYSAMGSIWSTFGQPCECSGAVCGCCAGLKIEQYKFDQKMCANVTFVPARAETLLEVYLNEQSSAKYGVSARNPAPFCIPVMMGVPMAMCVQMTNVQMVGNNLNMCMDFVVRLASTELFEMHFQCMRMGLDGVQYVDANGQPVLPSSTAIKSDAGAEYEDDVNDVNEEEDAAASAEYYDELEKQQAAGGIASQLDQSIDNAATYAEADEAEEVTKETTTEDMSYVAMTVEEVNEAEDEAEYDAIHEFEASKDSVAEGQLHFEMPTTQMSNVEIESEMLSLANNIDNGNVIANEPSAAAFTAEANTGSLSNDNDNDNRNNISNNNHNGNNNYNIDSAIGESELKQNELIEAITVAKNETASAATACSTTNAADKLSDLSEKECDNEIVNNNKFHVEYENDDANDDDHDNDDDDDTAEVEVEDEAEAAEEATEEANSTTSTGEQGEADVVADVVEEGSAAIDQVMTSAAAASGADDEFDNSNESVTSSDNYDLSDSSHSNTDNKTTLNNNNNNNNNKMDNSSISSNYIDNERNSDNDDVANGNDIANEHDNEHEHEHEQWHEHEYAHKYDEHEAVSSAYSDSNANDDDAIDEAATDEFAAAATANKTVVADVGDADGDGGGDDDDALNDVTAGSDAETLRAIKFYRHLLRF